MSEDKKPDGFAIVASRAIPVPRRGRAKKPLSDIYPFKDMAVGDMFVIAGKANVQKARNTAQAFVKENGGPGKWKFITRDLSNQDDGLGGKYEPDTYGMWRVVTTVQVGGSAQPTPTNDTPAVEPVLVVNPETPDTEQ